MSGLYPGQRVICIDGKLSPDVWEWTSQIPREGEIYTIQRVYNGTNRITGRREGGVDLVEVDTFLPGSLKGRLGWYAGRFAPLDVEEVSTRKRKKRSSRKKSIQTSPPQRRQTVSCSIAGRIEFPRTPAVEPGFIGESANQLVSGAKLSLPLKMLVQMFGHSLLRTCENRGEAIPVEAVSRLDVHHIAQAREKLAANRRELIL